MKTKVKSARLVIFLAMVVGAGALFLSETHAQETAYKIGDRGPAGGLIFYDKGNTSDGWRYLEAAPEDQSSKAAWGCPDTSIRGTKGTAIGTGKTNTATIIKRCEKSGIAAKAAADYRGGGKSDWFLPSKDELDLIYKNLKLIGAAGITNDAYWSSSENTASYAWGQTFNNGYQYKGFKSSTERVRAIRAF